MTAKVDFAILSPKVQKSTSVSSELVQIQESAFVEQEQDKRYYEELDKRQYEEYDVFFAEVMRKQFPLIHIEKIVDWEDRIQDYPDEIKQ